MQFYDFSELKAAADCREIAKALGLAVNDEGRCAATWRGGENPTSVHLDRDGWHDFGTEEGGTAIDLVAAVKFGGDLQQAQDWLGRHLGLTPKMELQPSPIGRGTRYQKLIDDGYAETCRYDYTDAAGTLVLQVIRMEHPEKGKTFLQQAADGKWTVKDCPPVLYHMPTIATRDWCVVVEGEKDADTLQAWDIPATCNPGGAKKWRDEYSAMLAGKDVVICPDNDASGRQHAETVAGSLAGKVRSIRIVTVSGLPKGDVTDWRDRENGSPEAFLSMISRAKPLDQGRLNEEYAVERAKDANEHPFRNYTPVWEKGKTVARKEPRHVSDMIREAHTRFLGFPRKVGEELFDHDRDTGRIVFLHKAPELFSWVQRKSGQLVDWTRGANYVTKDEFYAGIHAEADRYEAVSGVPDWPRRPDVYYSHPALPEPTGRDFARLVDMFEPLGEPYRNLLRAFICAPIYYEPGISRPMWIIDSERPGAGKSTLATTVAMLYGHAAVEVKTRDFARDMQEVTKRLVSSSGRQARILLVDNVIGTFVSEELAAMVTMPYITGRPSYGRGEESRPNNLTYVITANNASIDNDLTIRSFFIRLKALDSYSASWNRELQQFIAARRLNIFADILHLIDNHEPFADQVPATRFPEFDTQILQPCCGTAESYSETVKALADCRAEANVEEEWANAIEEVFRYRMVDLDIHPERESVWIRSKVAEQWIKEAVSDLQWTKHSVGVVLNLARNGHMPRIHPRLRVYPHRGANRRRGLLWMNAELETTPTYIVASKGRDGAEKQLAGAGGASTQEGF